ncbi:MAG: hypothetical protein HY308_11590 [Gammaproteobacteria bacterium]|nr:hypothetical protein [Gammaproteobacteria bacterium]
MKLEEETTEWLSAYQGFKKYLNQCVVCQEIGYDPAKMLDKEEPYFQKRVKEFFYPLMVNEIDICGNCVERLSGEGKNLRISGV